MIDICKYTNYLFPERNHDTRPLFSRKTGRTFQGKRDEKACLYRKTGRCGKPARSGSSLMLDQEIIESLSVLPFQEAENELPVILHKSDILQ